MIIYYDKYLKKAFIILVTKSVDTKSNSIIKDASTFSRFLNFINFLISYLINLVYCLLKTY